MKTVYDIIKRPIVTERSVADAANKRYTFAVAPDAGKTEIKQAVEAVFGVKVSAVNTMNYDGKEKRMGVHVGRRPAWKKAIVTLTKDSKTIEFFESMI